MKNVLISGYYGFNNTGDEAMIETMSILLAKRNYGLVVLSSNPVLISYFAPDTGCPFSVPVI